MKSIINSIKVALAIFSSSTIVWAQCAAPEKIVKSNSEKNSYKLSTQSKAGALLPGGFYEMAFIAQDGYDYKITSGAQNSSAGLVSFEIYEMVTEKDASGQFKKVKNIISSSDGTQGIEFTTDKARKLMIKVTLEAKESKKPECVAILIEDKKAIKIGF